MSIDTSGKWWKGTSFADLVEYIQLLTADGYPAERILQSTCACGNTSFHLLADPDEGCAQRICTECNHAAFIGDSAECWAEVTPKKVRCLCKQSVFEIAVGFSLRRQGEIKWITVGQRCVKCGVLASYVDWKIDYSPSLHLLTML
jgi:hypothetical protein